MDLTCEIEAIDESSVVITKGYGGNSGRKLCYEIDGYDYMVKFPKSTKDIDAQNLRSYTTSPISEFIGSKIYECLGIPVHETRLVACEGKIAVACKDFTVKGSFIPFSDIKNTVDEAEISGSYGSSPRGERLDDVMSVIENAPIFEKLRDSVKRRFWEMFVVDALILNNDRNNGNWGVLTSDDSIFLAPVFDNGNASFNKRNSDIFEKRMNSEALILNDIDVSCSFFLDNNDHNIHPFEYMRTYRDELIEDVLCDIVKKCDLNMITELVNSIPNNFEGISVIDDVQKEYYIKILEMTYKEKLVPLIA